MSAPTQKPPKERLSTAQMLHLMRLETDQALRHGHPVSCLVYGLDGFDTPHEMEARRALMPRIFRELKAVTFQSGVRGIGVFNDRFQIAVFPHLPPEKAVKLAEQLVERVHAVADPRPGAEGHVAVSVGVSHNQHKGEITFDSLVEEAETGAELARGAGGDRWIQAQDVENEVQSLQRELEAQIREVKTYQTAYLAEQDGLQESWGRNLIDSAIQLFEREPERGEAVLRLQKEVIALITSEINAWRNSSTVRQMIESHKQIDQLERRVQKLTHSLGVTEAELKRVAAMKNIDLGLASIYRVVQGLSSGDELYEQKKEMLKDLFEANVKLQEQLASM